MGMGFGGMGWGSGTGGIVGVVPMLLWWGLLILGIALLVRWLFGAAAGDEVPEDAWSPRRRDSRIAAALARIGGHDPALARLLSDTVHTGASCRYDPDPDRPVSWRLGTGQP